MYKLLSYPHILWGVLKMRNKLTFMFPYKYEGHCFEPLTIGPSTLTSGHESLLHCQKEALHLGIP